MSQPMPVVRQLYWPGVLPQVAGLAFFSAAVWLLIPRVGVGAVIFLGSLLYLIMCRILRTLLASEHRKGMAAYRARRFDEALVHFDASRRFFLGHPRLDAWRSLFLGVASYNSYRVIALGNMAFCYGQLGNGAKAIELYEEVLKEAPDHALAKAMLTMLRASQPQTTVDGATEIEASQKPISGTGASASSF